MSDCLRSMLAMARENINNMAESVAGYIFQEKREVLEHWADNNSELLKQGLDDEIVTIIHFPIPDVLFVPDSFMDDVAGELEELINNGEIFDVPVSVMWNSKHGAIVVELDV